MGHSRAVCEVGGLVRNAAPLESRCDFYDHLGQRGDSIIARMVRRWFQQGTQGVGVEQSLSSGGFEHGEVSERAFDCGRSSTRRRGRVECRNSKRCDGRKDSGEEALTL